MGRCIERPARIHGDTMPLFYFHLRTGAAFEPDDVGLEMESLESAYLSACETVPGLMSDLARERADPCGSSFEIADAAGRILMEVPFGECIGRTPARPAKPAPAAVENEVLFARMDRVMLSIRDEVRTLQDNMARAKARAARICTPRSVD